MKQLCDECYAEELQMRKQVEADIQKEGSLSDKFLQASKDRTTDGEDDDHRIREPTPSTENKHNKILVDFGPWEIMRGKFAELNREYNFTNLGGLGTKTKIDLRCRLTLEDKPTTDSYSGARSQRKLVPFVYLVVDPYLLEQTKIVVAFFAPSDDLVGYKALTAKVEAGATGINFIVFDIADGEHLLDILMLGRQITLRLIVPPADSIAAVPLENDGSFRVVFEQLKSS